MSFLSPNNMLKAMLLISLLIPISAFIQILAPKNWVTGPQQVKWVNGNTQEKLKNWSGCHQSEENTQIAPLNVGQALWTVCSHPTLGKSLVTIKPFEKLGVLWPFPKSHPHQSTEGFAVSSKGLIAIVYRTDSERQNLAVGLFDENGWQKLPKDLPNSAPSYLRAVVWLSNRLNIIYHGYSEEYDYPNPAATIVKVKKDDLSMTQFPSTAPLCDGYICHQPCQISLRNGLWQSIQRRDLLVEGYDEEESNITLTGYIISDESGKFTGPIKREKLCKNHDYFSDNVDHSEMGVTHNIPEYFIKNNRVYMQNVIGAYTPLEKPLNKEWSANLPQGWYTATTLGLKRHIHWDFPKGYGFKHNNRWYLFHPADNRLHLTTANSQGMALNSNIIGKNTSERCHSLSSVIPMESTTGRITLTSPDGCFLQVDEQLQRLDQLSILDHLKDLSENNPDWKDLQFLVQFFWLFIGMPISLFVVFITHIGAKTRPYFQYSWSLLIFMLTGFFCLLNISPIEF